MKIAYFDCCSGISGDMVLGALIDMGLDIRILRRELSKLRIRDYSISASKAERHHITGTSFKVKFKESRHHRTFTDIKNLINKSKLSAKVKELSVSIFFNLAKAEAKVHGCKVAEVHFHEVGAVDSIVDIVGTAVGVEQLGTERIYASALPLGSGWVETAHGRMPVPAPAALELLMGVPVIPSSVKSELTTPTGAAIIKTIAKGFGNMPQMKIEKIGYGIGTRDFEQIPNILRIVTGEGSGGQEKLIMIETNIDDMNPQIYDYLMTRLFKKGALDVFLTPIQMKKGRPAVL
ncbi:MAG: nickel pincer cofactor biosynthesis protein LarC, partial [Deltaproteobacteria bacterium]